MVDLMIHLKKRPGYTMILKVKLRAGYLENTPQNVIKTMR